MNHRPDFATFVELARHNRAVPVYRQLLSDTLTPVTAFSMVQNGGPCFLFESVIGGEKVGRYSFLGADPFLTLEAYDRQLVLADSSGSRRLETSDPLRVLEELLARHRAAHLGELPRFCGGAVGYAGYDAVRYTEHLPNAPQNDRGLPDLSFAFYDRMVIFDHIRKTIAVVAHAGVAADRGPLASQLADLHDAPPVRPGASDIPQPNPATEARARSTKDLRAVYDDACRRVDELVKRLRDQVHDLKLTDINLAEQGELLYESNFERSQFEAAVRKCKEYIRAGDVFQVVISQRLKTETAARPFDIYRTLRVVNPSPFMIFLRSPTVTLVASSPEIMVRVENNLVTIRPLAGTRPRGRTEVEDEQLAAELLADPKERAEHIMLVDLGRNDVGRVAQYNTVKLSDVMTVERYSHVMHITSNVTGELAPGKTALDALRACLPAGTVSGAPKVRAMQIIDEIEPHRRGPYAGAIGYLDFTGNMDTCIALRTLVLQGRTAYIQAGAGIVYDSVPEREYEETINKARGLLKAIKIAETQL